MNNDLMLVPRELLKRLYVYADMPADEFGEIAALLAAPAVQAVDEDAERAAFEAWHTKHYFPEVWDGRLHLIPGYFDRYDKQTYERCVGYVPAGEYVREEHRKDFALWLARAALAAPVQKDQVWHPLSGAGQISAGDWLCFTVGGKFFCVQAREILNAGTDREEIIYNRSKNHYFITSMAVSGESSHKGVMMARPGAVSCCAAPVQPTCKTCNGSRIVPDGAINGSGGM